jgi:hypothetical protein
MHILRKSKIKFKLVEISHIEFQQNPVERYVLYSKNSIYVLI